MSSSNVPAVWFLAIKAGTGTDVFTERMALGLRQKSHRAEITWLPPRAEYAPWTVEVPQPPSWADLIHVNTWLHPRFIPRNIPVVATLHHALHDPSARSYKGIWRAAYHQWWIASIERQVLHRAQKVVAVSQFAAASAQQSLVDVPIQVIPNGVDTRIFQPTFNRRRSEEAFRLLYVGSWKRLKGVDLLAPILRELGDGFKIYYTGDPVRSKKRVEVSQNMINIGRCRGDREVAAAMQNADALLFPSRSEGFGLVVAEAMACGLPVVATRQPPFTEIIQHGATGLLCRKDDVREFASTIRTLAANKPLRAGLAEAARDRVEKNLSAGVMLSSYQSIYQSLLRRDG